MNYGASLLNPSTENTVKRSEFAMLLDWAAGTAAPFEDGEHYRAELALEFRFVEDAAELARYRVGRQLVYAAAERAKDNAVVSVLEGKPVDGADFVELYRVTLRRKASVNSHVLPFLVAVAVRLAKTERRDSDDTAGKRVFAEGISIAQVPTKEHDARRIDSAEVDVQRIGVETMRDLGVLYTLVLRIVVLVKRLAQRRKTAKRLLLSAHSPVVAASWPSARGEVQDRWPQP